jgi:hypothetical protein
MRKTYLSYRKLAFLFLLTFNFGNVKAQSAGFNNTFIILQLNGGSVNYYDLKATTSNPDFQSFTLGNFGPSNSILLKGAEHNVWKCGGCDLTSTRLNYRIYLTASPNGSYSNISIPYSSGSNNGCGGQDQQWRSDSNSINLISGLTIEGNYTIEVFSEATITCSGGTAYASNNGSNYKATFNYYNSSTWNGTAWSNGTPTSSIDAIIAGDYSTTANGVFTAKTLTVNASKSFTINGGNTITVAGAITDNGNLVVQNNANLIQTNTTPVTNTGSIAVNRNSSNIQLYDYTLWSSPVAGQKLKAFSPDTLDARFYSYNSGTNLYNVVSAPATTDFASATGYLIRTPNTWTASTPTTFNGVFTGVPNNGDIPFTMSVGASGFRYNLVGNPYPSPISIASFVSDNSTITGTLYFWRKTNGTGTAYCTYTGSTFTTNGNAQAANPNGIIQTGQGFFVEANGTGTALLFKNSQRVSNTAGQFFRTNNVIENNRIWLNATNTSGAFSQMAVGYMTDATPNVDSLDGKYINDSPFALTSLIGSEEFTIQGRALPFSTSDSIPLGFKTDAAGNYTIAIDHVDGLFSSGQAIYLKDNLLNTVTELSAGSYSFASAVGTFNSRFELVFQRVLGNNNPEFTSNNVVAFNDHGDIKINSGSTVMDQVRVYDLQGRLLVEKKQINATETSVTTTAVNQILLLEITGANGIKVTKKMIQ